MSELSISQLRQQLRQEMRRYSAASIADAALRLLWKEYPDRVEAQHILPWNILLLIKWALQAKPDRAFHLRRRRLAL